MIRRLLVVPVLLACMAGPSPASALAAAPSASVRVPDEVVVRFRDRVDLSQRAALRDLVDADAVRRLPLPGGQLLRLQGDVGVAMAIARLERTGDVLYAEPNIVRTSGATMNDPFFGQLWGLRNSGQLVQGSGGTAGADIAAPAAWDLATGSAAASVAVIDSGVAGEHPDLRGQIAVHAGEIAGNGIDDDANGYADDVAGWDFVGDDAVPDDANGHGTHVAGTIGARGNDGVGVVGVAPTTRIMPLRVLDANGSGTVGDAISAYGYAARNGARVVNLSLGGDNFSRAERDAIAAAPEVLFVVAAGNGGSDGSGDDNDVAGRYPCAYDLANVVCVAASDRDDRLASFSNYGSTSVDLAAPGVSILSDLPPSSTAPRYAFYAGTSMAAPHVAGAAALAFALSPGASVAAVKQALLAGSVARPALAGTTVSGGRLDARRTLERLSERPTTAAPAPSTESPAATASPPPAATTSPAAPAGPPSGPQPTSAPAAQAPPDTAPPLASLLLGTRHRVAAVRRLGLRARVTCLEACAATAVLRLSPRDARRARLGSGARSVTIGRAGRHLQSATSLGLKVRLTTASARALGRLTRAANATLTVAFVDAVGNRRTLRKAVVLLADGAAHRVRGG